MTDYRLRSFGRCPIRCVLGTHNPGLFTEHSAHSARGLPERSPGCTSRSRDLGWETRVLRIEVLCTAYARRTAGCTRAEGGPEWLRRSTPGRPVIALPV